MLKFFVQEDCMDFIDKSFSMFYLAAMPLYRKETIHDG